MKFVSRLRRMSAGLLACLFMVSGLVLPTPAYADNGGYPFADHYGPGTNPKTSTWTDHRGNPFSPNGYAFRNCTDYIAWRLQQLGVPNSRIRGLGDANKWAVTSPARGLVVDTIPAAGSVAVKNTGIGHVAYVEAVHGRQLTVSEYNATGDGTYRRRTAALSTLGFDQYIHTEALLPNPPTVPSKGVGEKLLGDVNGDGRADAVVMFRDSGTAMVALGQASGSFNDPIAWSHGHSVNASNYYLADVNGDNKADLVAFYAATGAAFVSSSAGGGFWSPTAWAYGHGAQTTKQFVNDVTGDARADLVTFNNTTGSWEVSASSGSGFWSPQRWIQGHGVGSKEQILADFNGDKKADAAIYIAATGAWHIGLAHGSGFGYPGAWSHGHGNKASIITAGDVGGDGMADIAYHDRTNYKWSVSGSAGTGFWGSSDWSYDGPSYSGMTASFLADINGDRKADKVIYFNDSGNWYVALSSGGGFWPIKPAQTGHGAQS